MTMSPENKALIERELDDFEKRLLGKIGVDAQIERIMNAVRAEERAKAVEVVRPFADFGENVDTEGWTSNIHREGISVWFGPSDFRRAAAYITESQSQEGESRGSS